MKNVYNIEASSSPSKVYKLLSKREYQFYWETNDITDWDQSKSLPDQYGSHRLPIQSMFQLQGDGRSRRRKGHSMLLLRENNSTNTL